MHNKRFFTITLKWRIYKDKDKKAPAYDGKIRNCGIKFPLHLPKDGILLQVYLSSSKTSSPLPPPPPSPPPQSLPPPHYHHFHIHHHHPKRHHPHRFLLILLNHKQEDDNIWKDVVPMAVVLIVLVEMGRDDDICDRG